MITALFQATLYSKTKMEMESSMMKTVWYWVLSCQLYLWIQCRVLDIRILIFRALFQSQSGHSILNRKRGELIFTNDTNLDAELVSNLWRGEGTSNVYPSASGLKKRMEPEYEQLFCGRADLSSGFKMCR
jgi:hypothetical protein